MYGEVSVKYNVAIVEVRSYVCRVNLAECVSVNVFCYGIKRTRCDVCLFDDVIYVLMKSQVRRKCDS